MKEGLPSRLFLSRLMLNPLSRQVMSEQAHPYEMHRTIMRGFPKQASRSSMSAREEFGVLFRCEPDLEKYIVRVYVQSLVEPDWSFLESIENYLSNNVARSIEYKDVMPAYNEIKEGQLLSFRLKANPTKRVADNNDPLKGKRVNLFRESEQIEWLVRKSKRPGNEDSGFEIPCGKTNNDDRGAAYLRCVRVRNDGKVRCLKKENGDKDQGYVITQYAVTYDGILRVTDNASFIRTLIHGIGPGKAFGFGLLSVAPLGTFDKQR